MNQLFVQTEKIVDPREGKLQVVSNVDVCTKIAEFLESTLGPYGMDKLFAGKEIVVTNDGATILKHMNIRHPVGRLLVALSESQDSEVGDGTTSVVILTTEILSCLKPLIKDNFDLGCIKGCLEELRMMCIEHLEKMGMELDDEVLYKLAGTCITSKNIRHEKEYFSRMIVDAVKQAKIDDAESIGVKKVQGGSIGDSVAVNGIAFEKCFTYAGYEQQPKRILNPRILCLNVELEWKSERDNAEIRVGGVEEYQRVVDAEWAIIRRKLDEIISSGANVVLSSLSIGDYATQYFAKHGIFCAGRVSKEDLGRVVGSCGGSILGATDYLEGSLGACALFEERQLGKFRYNYFEGGGTSACTMILRGPGQEVLEEIGRSVHDAVCVVRTALRTRKVVTGGGSVEMELSRIIREKSMKYDDKRMFVAKAVGQAFEKIPLLLARNFGLDTISTIQDLRKRHANGDSCEGISIDGARDMQKLGIYEPLEVKKNMVKASFSAAASIIMIDSTIMAEKSQ
ncbi:T COMPLEX PROTEIN 1 ETA SUBUNIT [Encephalitozoon cuniculi GB-M1]|uniref:T-complex protein 1 subunit eta n=1 Tax=Encephalitozoon cuniculi (strain GB-M1) TaxID=284813 RepID=TCPH_ENCCU|nr:T-complex protein 1 subunit eta [Encephalitozoon cuniculi GB-M1]Q8SR53.1 RecName: Full=T-complex protein 1 subunit eta; Short=TCP-1-eta; AltName: Full=CCT-eta [Encephalitozoon cuniculi GB-M1]KMV65214.1 T-complex protein 1 subunit eta [Encephalitozoon cuniculi EcunIII-L]CAD25782.1 T COMPLEX PROTEIN 1 ETA SUBUNIT [Encephalitozoon cuniculi GB-M1]